MRYLASRGLAAALIALAGLASAAQAGAPATDWKETLLPGEAELAATFAKEINKMQDEAAAESGGKVDRGFHAKQHTVVRAQLKVTEWLPAELRQGVFAKAATYEAWIRFSNGQGNRQADRKPDVRGFAVKVLDVPGQPLTPGIKSFDVLCINHAAQPARDIRQFVAFVRAAGNLLTAPVKLAAAVGIREATRMLTWAAKRLGVRVSSMATTDFYSAVPFAFGKYAVKMRFAPKNAAGNVASGDSDYLRHDLEGRLKNGDLTWDVMVQFYADARSTPIEDASVEWTSSWLKAGELTVAKRDLTSAAAKADEAQGNALLWNPWHAPSEHRPLGSLMRARRVVYPASGQHRGATHE